MTKEFNDLGKSSLTGIGIKYIDEYLESGKEGKAIFDEDNIKIYEHTLQMGYIIIEVEGLDDERKKEFIENISSIPKNSETPTYIGNILKDGKIFVVMRKDQVGEQVINFGGKLLSIL